MSKGLKRTCQCLVVAVLPLVSGCSGLLLAGSMAAGGGGGYYLYSRGTYVALLDASLFDSDRALRSVARRARFVQLTRKCDDYGASYLYRDTNAIRVRFRLRGVSPEATELHIRVGRLGDKASSRALLQAVDEELQAARR